MTQQALKKVSLRPLGDRVLVQHLEQEDNLKGGIILPDSAKKKQEIATVLAIGTGKTTSDGKTLPMPVEVGDKVLMDKYSGQEVSVEGEDYTILHAKDIIAKIEE